MEKRWQWGLVIFEKVCYNDITHYLGLRKRG